MKRLIKLILNSSPTIFQVIKFIYLNIRHTFSRFKWLSLKKRKVINLELGSGPKAGIGDWITVDQHGADISWDLRNGIPLDTGSVAKIYSSHLLEHMLYEQLLPFLTECRRVLSDGGEFLVCVPNAGHYVNAYVNGTMFREKETWYQPALVDTYSCIDQLNYIAYMGGEHKYMFDEENLCKTLTKSGFSKATLRSFDSTIDLKDRDIESIYAVAIK
jgi:predicted SAM-dependent methyltransferase